MPANFPSNPQTNATYNLNGVVWRYTGVYWEIISSQQINGVLFTAANSAPSSPSLGDRWLDTNTMIELVYVYDGTSYQWVQLTSQAPSGANRELSNLTTTSISANLVPASNITYDLGSSSQRWRDLYLSGNTMYLGAAALSATGSSIQLPAGSTVGGTVVATTTDVTTSGGPKIANLQVATAAWAVLDDTAVDTAGGYIIITGSNFVSGCLVYFNQTPATSVGYVSTTTLRITVPALAAGTYVVYVINPDGGTAIRVPGMTSSATPSWVTGSSLPEQTDNVAITLSLVATSAVSYALSSGSLPPGLSLNANTGVITGTVTSVTVDTSYTFTVTATDAELQDSPRTFTVTIAVSDPYFRYTTLLLSGSAISGNTVIRDSSTNNFNLTVYGDARASNFTPYGTGWSVQFDGNGDYLSLADNTAFAMGSGNWTLEAWVYLVSYTGTSAYGFIYDGRPLTINGFYLTLYHNNGVVRFFTNNNSRVNSDEGSTVTLAVGQWYHIAVSKSGNATKMFINGVQTGNTYTDNNTYINGSSRPLIGANSFTGPSDFLNGYISNLRLVKGTALYTANFTPATTNLTAVANTSLLTCNANRFLDGSTNNFTITRNGDARVVSFNPFNITNTGVDGSMYFDGTGDYLSTSNPTFAVGTGAFTIEAWVYPFTVSGKALVSSLASSVDPAGDRGIACYLDGARIGRSVTAQLDDISTSIVPVAYQWNHIALVRENTSTNGVKFYVNGLLGGQGTSAISVNKQQVVVGRQYPSEDYNYLSGYISSVRWTNAAVYTSAFTPPTQSLTAIANTSLLTCQYDQPHNNHTFLDSSSNQFLITRNGNASQGTFSPFSPNGWSVFFDGSNDFLELSTQAILNVGTGNFTVECFINFTNKAQTWSRATVLGTTEATSSSALLIQVLGATQGAGGIAVNAAGAGITASTTLATNTWHHIAAVRNSGTMILYINGTASGNVSSSGSLTTPSYKIGAFKATDPQYDDYYNGYVSNFRTANVAVYTSNFTPPIAPLTLTTGGQNPPQSGQAKFLSCQSNRFLDVGPGAYTVTPTNGPTIQAFSPFAPSAKYAPETHGGSGYFDGTNDYLSIPNTAFNNIITGTIECWVYLTDISGACITAKQQDGVTTQGLFTIGKYANTAGALTTGTPGFLYWHSTNTSPATANSTAGIVANTWNHIAIVFNSSSVTFYINGVASGTTNGNYSLPSNTAPIPTIGQWIASGTQQIGTTGWISSLRITADSVYPGNFTPPTAPLSTTTNTSLLVNFTDAAILDSTGRNVLETVADAKTSSVVTKFTGGSLFFDGSGDYLTFPVSRQFEVVADVTIEFWVYLISLGTGGSNPAFFGWGNFTSKTFAYIYNDGRIAIGIQGTNEIVSAAGQATTYSWIHLAFVRNGSTTTIYKNGTSIASNTTAVWYGSTGTEALQINGSVTNCYISDFRFTKFARYTGNFTAPTLPHRLK